MSAQLSTQLKNFTDAILRSPKGTWHPPSNSSLEGEDDTFIDTYLKETLRVTPIRDADLAASIASFIMNGSALPVLPDAQMFIFENLVSLFFVYPFLTLIYPPF